ncbi:hypothetical protein RN001_007570 [Aquatica leii]|uniref:Outer dynein arm-docking complex subunit 4 n=1 Tax=Aquatica leii TaxID=1421715 RepID=A0AAN7PWH6_9COLE|nr:hypothetical protein RN001_007570 [Aquatica leii]
METRRVSAYGILDINRDAEVLNRYVLTDIDEQDKEPIEGDQKCPLKAIAQQKSESYGIIKSATAKKGKDDKRVDFETSKSEIITQSPDQKEPEKIEAIKDEGVDLTPTKTTIEKTDDAKKVKKKIDPKRIKDELKKKRKKRKRPKPEELYTDKDRAAAVNMGNKDIKQSLRIKRRQDRTKNLQMPEEAEPTTFLGLANFEMSKGEAEIALIFLNKALELNPTDKNCLVARSRCYLLLGQPENGLKDAESALTVDKNFMKGIYQKAESLYYLGDFEHSLMYHHRGLRIRPDFEGFQLGVQKAQKAIENAIGGVTTENKRSSTLSLLTKSSSKSRVKGTATTTSKTSSMKNTPEPKLEKESSKSTQRNTPIMRPMTVNKNNNSKLLRELRADKEYLDNLLNHPDLKCKNKEDDSVVVGYIKDAIDFLNTRQEFWRQQLPSKYQT